MPDVFISYAHADQAKASRIAELLTSQGFEVWWDKDILVGHRFDKVIEAKLKAASAVLVLWSRRSVESDWVRAEADVAAANRTMIPARLERVELPLPHRLTQTLDFTTWAGDTQSQEFRQLVAAIERGRLAAYETLLAAATRRSKGGRGATRELTSIADAGTAYSDYARLELAHHEFARLGDLRVMPTVRELAREAREPFVVKTLGLLSALCLLASGQLEAALGSLVSNQGSQQFSRAQRAFMALHELLVYGALDKRDAMDAAWKTLIECQQESFGRDYPLVDVQRRFDRAVMSVIYSQDQVEDLVAELPIREYRGLTHLAAATAKAVRKSPFILQRIETRARLNGWTRLTDVTALRRRCRSFEILVLPTAGTL